MRERLSKATVVHTSHCIEVSVPTPPRKNNQVAPQIRKVKSMTFKGVPRMRLFRSKRSGKNSCPDESNGKPQDVVIVSKAQSSRTKPSLQISIPSLDANGQMPSMIPISSTQSSSDSPKSAIETAVMDPLENLKTSPPANIERKQSNSMDDPPRGTYFMQADFSRNNWLETMASQSTDSVSLGFLSIMAATVVIHPILFITGAATAVWAVGTVHAVERGYEFFSDGQFKNMFWADAEVEQFEDRENAPNCSGKNDSDNRKSPSIVSPDGNSPSDSFIPRAPLTDETTSIAMRPPISPLTTPRTPASFRRHVTPTDVAITDNFPPLKTDVVNAEFPGLNALEFFHVFFSDDAPYSFKEFQQTRGDVDITFGKWIKYEGETASFHPDAKARLKPESLPTCSKKERVLNFKTLTKSYFGPAYATAKKTQRVHKFSTRLVIVESMTELFDIPYCDRFFLVEKWIIESCKHDKKTNPSMLYTTKLSVSVEIFMLRSCSWESQIRSKTLSTMSDWVTSWSAKATQALDLTLKRKLERMREFNDAHQHDAKSLYSYRSKESRMSKHVKAIAISPKKQGNRLPTVPGKSRQLLMDIHQNRLKELDKKAASGDLEWCSIEIKHSAHPGKGKPLTEVLEDTPGMLASDLEKHLSSMDLNDDDEQSDDCPKEISITTKMNKNKKIGTKKRLFPRKKSMK